MPGGEADLAVAIEVRELGQFVELVGIDSAGRNAKAHRAQAGFELRREAEMVGVMRAAHVSSLKGKFMPHARGEFCAEPGNAPVFHQKREATLGARLARAMIAEDSYQFEDRGNSLETLDEDVQM